MGLNIGNFQETGPIGYAEKGGSTVLSPNSGGALGIGEVVITNRSGGNIDVGWGWKQPNSLWVAGQIDASATPDFIDDTTDAQDAGAGDFALTTTTNNDGFLIASKIPFHYIGMDVSTAAAGSPVYAVTYYNGSSMAAMPLYDSFAVGLASTGAQAIAFPAPHDWAKGTTAAVATTLSDYYCVQVVATTAPTTAALASTLWVGTIMDFYPLLADNAQWDTDMKAEKVIPCGASVLPIFGTAASGNTIELHYRNLGV